MMDVNNLTKIKNRKLKSCCGYVQNIDYKSHLWLPATAPATVIKLNISKNQCM